MNRRRLGFLSHAGAASEALATTLRPDFAVSVPEAQGSPWSGAGWRELDTWRGEVSRADRWDDAVVCAWPAEPLASPATEVSLADWDHHVEWNLACWTSALVAAANSCSDGGSIVLVAEIPAAIDASGHLASVVVGDGLSTFARSLAYDVGARGVRVNVVASQIATTPDRLLGSQPPMANFPGTVEVEVAGAVRLLLDRAASGITGTVVRADCGRAW